jgi:glutamine amidotransferase
MIALIDYGAGNTASVSNILKELSAEFLLSNDKQAIENADKVILPGVGEASSAMKRLMELGLIDTLKNMTKPFLGICLGMQLLCKSTEEGDSDCLGILELKVKRFEAKNLKVPHMGWNSLKKVNEYKLLSNISEGEYFYFAHSYYVPQNEFASSLCNYGFDFASSIKYKNFYGVQFHPEKSSRQGIQIIKNFLEIC